MKNPKKKAFESRLPEHLGEGVCIIRQKLIEAEKRQFSSLELSEIVSRVLRVRELECSKSK